MAEVVLPRALLALFPEAEKRVSIDGGTVGDLIDGLDARWPGMRDRLCASGPRLRDFVNVFVDGEPADLSSPVAGTSVVHVLPAVAGGEWRPVRMADGGASQPATDPLGQT